MKKPVRSNFANTTQYVLAHAAWQRSRGRKPSMGFAMEKNPLKALALAVGAKGFILMKPRNRFEEIDLAFQLFFVHKDGYLQSNPCYEASIPFWGVNNHYCTNALHQADRGEMPDHLDNSAMIQVDRKYAGQVLFIPEKMSDGITQNTKVYTKDGVRVPCKIHHPLSYARWAPQSSYAKYGRTWVAYN